MTEIIKNTRKVIVQILSNEELKFADELINELEGIPINEKIVQLAFCIAIKNYSQEKKDFIINHFGIDINNNLELLYRIANISVPNNEKKIQSLREVFIELSGELIIIILKLYERLVFLKTLFSNNDKNEKFTPELIQLSNECLNLYSPIAHRLGIRKIYNQMENIAFQVLYPTPFKKIHNLIEKNRIIYNEKLLNTRKILLEQMSESKINCDIQYRVKQPYSIYKKIVKQNSDISKVYDLLALRIITDKVENCYLALGIVHRNWIPIEERFKDWVTFPKPNGYRSIQTTVFSTTGDKFEIQIRTKEMHQEAEYGSAAHWAYKEKVNTDAKWINKLKEFLENDEYFNNPQALEDIIQNESKKKYIHILTPKGEIKSILEGATILDFAGTIHTEVLYKCTGGRVNGKFVKLKTELKTGDVVEIITNKNSKPSRDWLKIIKSPTTRTKVIQWLKKNESTQLMADGKRAFERFKKDNRKKINDFDDEASFKENLSKIGYKNTDDFYSAIGTNSLKLNLTLLRKLYPKAFVKKKDISHKERTLNKIEEIRVTIEGLKNIQTSLAKCCNPKEGDIIIAYVSRSGIKIHSIDCQYVTECTDKAKLKTASWD